MDKTGQNRTKQLFTLPEAAAYLRVAEKTVLRMARRGEIPSAKVGGQWRFRRHRIDAWLDEQEAAVRRDEPLALLHHDDRPNVPLSRIIREEFVVIGMAPGETFEIVKRLTEPLVNAAILDSADEFVERVVDRERIASTEITEGVAIPHARKTESNPSGTPGIVAGTCPAGAPFGDARSPVRLFFLLCAEADVPHLRLLQLATRLVRIPDAVESLAAADTPTEFIESILALEARAGKGASAWS